MIIKKNSSRSLYGDTRALTFLLKKQGSVSSLEFLSGIRYLKKHSGKITLQLSVHSSSGLPGAERVMTRFRNSNTCQLMDLAGSGHKPGMLHYLLLPI